MIIRHSIPITRIYQGGDLLADIVRSVLAEQDAILRRQHPDLFARVDEIKLRPNRQPQGDYDLARNPEKYRVQECPWCGESFVAERRSRGRWQITCSHSCRAAYQKWLARRSKAS